MLSVDAWRTPENVSRHLARELSKGRLALFLGAGASAFYGLPQWKALVDALCDEKGEPRLGPNDDPILKVGAIRTKYYNKKTDQFLADIERLLYAGVSVDFEKLRTEKLLAAIGALLMGSKRGTASRVMTLNYDDLVELYLEYHGLIVASVSDERHWIRDADVTVYHPHGLLPLKPDIYRTRSADIVFGSEEYKRIMKPESLWKTTLLGILRTHTTVYIGQSGADDHIQTLQADLKATHAICNDRVAFHGVRFHVGPPDDLTTVLEGYGVATVTLNNWDELATFLFRTVQLAREERLKQT